MNEIAANPTPKPRVGIEGLDVYRVAVQFYRLLRQSTRGRRGHALDQACRAAESVVLNIAEAYPMSGPDRARRFRIAGGEAAECHSETQRPAKRISDLEGPDASIGHVRIRGGSGSESSRSYPSPRNASASCRRECDSHHRTGARLSLTWNRTDPTMRHACESGRKGKCAKASAFVSVSYDRRCCRLHGWCGPEDHWSRWGGRDGRHFCARQRRIRARRNRRLGPSLHGRDRRNPRRRIRRIRRNDRLRRNKRGWDHGSGRKRNRRSCQRRPRRCWRPWRHGRKRRGSRDA